MPVDACGYQRASSSNLDHQVVGGTRPRARVVRAQPVSNRVILSAEPRGAGSDKRCSVHPQAYVSSITAPFVADILEGDPARTNFKYVPGLRAYPPGPQGLPLLKPPYGPRPST